MKRITERTSYLRGLADGMNLDKEKTENKLLLEMLAVMDDMAQMIQQLDSDVDELDEYMASMDEDLSEMEDVLFDNDEDTDDMDEWEDEEEIEVNCPHCAETFVIHVDDVAPNGEILCPSCGKSILEPGADQE